MNKFSIFFVASLLSACSGKSASSGARNSKPPETDPKSPNSTQSDSNVNAPTDQTNSNPPSNPPSNPIPPPQAPQPAATTTSLSLGSPILITSTSAVTELTVSWGAAIGDGVEYKVVTSSIVEDIDTLAEVNALPAQNVVMNWSTQLNKVVTVDANVSSHAFAVVAKDVSGNFVLYAPKEVNRLTLETTGLISGTSVSIQLNSSLSETISTNGEQKYFGWFAPGDAYNFSVTSATGNLVCDFPAGSGVIARNTEVQLICTPPLRVYVTSAVTNGVFSGGSTGADTFCQNDVNKPTVRPATYKAMVAFPGSRVACASANCGTGGSSEGVDWVFKPNRRYVRSSDSQLLGTTTSRAIFESDLLVTFHTSSVLVWTGMIADWRSSGNNCQGWTSNVSTQSGTAVFTNVTSKTAAPWGSGTSSACHHFSRRVICVEQPVEL